MAKSDRARLWVVACLVAGAAGCGGDDSRDQAWNPSDPSTGAAGETTDAASGTTTGESNSGVTLEDSTGASDPTLDTGGSGDPSESDTETGGPNYDCAPVWDATWIGSPCADDADCTYEGGTCIREDEGFPCGTCSQACDSQCPDLDGTPETFCVDGSDVGLPAAGNCLSKCDPGLVGGNGCRDGYACSAFERYNDPSASAGVCVPLPFAGDADTACQEALLDLGAVFEVVDHTPEAPDGNPGVLCTIDEPMLLHSPVNGVAIRYVDSASDSEVFVGCQAALSIVASAAIAQNLGADELIHIGTYNCRTIANSNNISEHGHANAIDIYGFTMQDGTEYSVLDDWEDGNPNPTTVAGIMLRTFTDQAWGMNLWNTILTPEYNSDHNNHFHVDRKEGNNTYE